VVVLGAGSGLRRVGGEATPTGRVPPPLRPRSAGASRGATLLSIGSEAKLLSVGSGRSGTFADPATPGLLHPGRLLSPGAFRGANLFVITRRSRAGAPDHSVMLTAALPCAADLHPRCPVGGATQIPLCGCVPYLYWPC